MRDVYGTGVTAKQVLRDDTIPVPAAARAFPTTLDGYSSRKAVARQDAAPAR
jgi:hypothetical protein